MLRLWMILIGLLTALPDLKASQHDTTAVDLVDLVIGRKKFKEANQIRADRKVYFSLFPAPVSTPGGGRAVITAVNAAFHLGDPETTNLSNVYFIPYTDLATRFGLYVKPTIWLSENKWNFIGDYRLASFPQYTWGLGGNTQEFERTLIDTDFLRVYQNALKRIGDAWFAGVGYALDYHYNIEEREVTMETGHLERYSVALADPSVSSGLTMNVAYDRRINVINPPGGSYFMATWRVNQKALGSDQDYQTLYLDARKYIPFSAKRVNLLALRGYYWTVLTGEAPYIHLPSTNWPPAFGTASRGIQSGRYRSNAMVYGEAEHRYQLTPGGLIGMVVFMNFSSVSEFETQQFKYWKVGAGTGIRLKLNKYSGANLAIDFGFSENFWSVWLNVGEMF